MKPIILFLFCFFASTITLFGQTKSTPSVNITPDTRSIETPPFDVKFGVNSFKTEYSDISFKYEINTDDTKGLYYLTGAQNLSVNPSTGMAHFSKLVGPIHPDQDYTFTLVGTRYFTLDENKEKALRAETYALVEKYLSSLAVADEAMVAAFKVELLSLLKKTADVAESDDLYDTNNDVIGSTRLGSMYINKTIEKNDAIKDAIKAIKNNFTTEGDAMVKLIVNAAPLFAKLAKIDEGTLVLSTAAKALYDAPINTSVVENKTLTMRELFSFLNQNEKVYLASIYKEGHYKKLKGSTLVPSTTLDKETLVLLKTAFEKLNYEFFKDTNGSAISSNPNVVENIVRKMASLISNLEKYELEVSKLNGFKDEIPDILKNAFAKEEISFSKSVEINVFAEKNAYIGLDLGLLYGFDIDGVFSFQSVNFYFKPVNREAPFKNFQKGDRFWKRFSVYVGLAQLLSDEIDDFDNLLASNSLIVGGGYRLSRVLRLSVGGMLHKEVDTRTLVNDSNLKFSPTVSLSVDVDLTKALGAIGNAIKL